MPHTIRCRVMAAGFAAVLSLWTAAAVEAQAEAPHDRRDPTVARVLSGIGTLTPLILQHEGHAGMPLVMGGIVLGPLPGYLYAGEARSGMTQAAIRAGLLAAGYGGFVAICSAAECDAWESGGTWTAGVTVLVVGYFGSTALGLYDVHRVGRVTAARNQRVSSLSVQPTYLPQTGRTGIQVSWRH
jgi:hypothetical protein